LLTLKQSSAFTIGICASDESKDLPALLELIQNEKYPEEMTLLKIVVVASNCSKSSMESLRAFMSKDSRIVLIEEDRRRGKAEAMNKIVEQSVGSYVLFVNSDALPLKGSMAELLSMIKGDDRIGMACAKPFFSSKAGLTSMVELMMWSVHNECSALLNHLGKSNHGSDEMMAVRSDTLEFLPRGLVNDGAFLGGRARLNGYSVKFCSSAPVRINVPSRIVDLIGQRRRIIFGHFQVWKLTGNSPKTIETLLLSSPQFSIGIVVKTLARTPKLIMALPLAIVSESISYLLAIRDSLTSTRKHGVWKRYGN
jgi:cellulose synthase/poly-beta-1,6-N-acetylglucosamine synthase-like glycosyltransferase